MYLQTSIGTPLCDEKKLPPREKYEKIPCQRVITETGLSKLGNTVDSHYNSTCLLVEAYNSKEFRAPLPPGLIVCFLLGHE